MSRFSGAAASETGIWFPQPLLKFFVFAFFFFLEQQTLKAPTKGKKKTLNDKSRGTDMDMDIIHVHGGPPLLKPGEMETRARGYVGFQFSFSFSLDTSMGMGMGIWVYGYGFSRHG